MLLVKIVMKTKMAMKMIMKIPAVLKCLGARRNAVASRQEGTRRV